MTNKTRLDFDDSAATGEKKPFSKLDELLKGLTADELRTLRSKINGKLGKRKITPEQQAKMQAARRRKVDNHSDM